jgi:hypothetical protein
MKEILSDLTVTIDCSIIHVVFGRCIFGSDNAIISSDLLVLAGISQALPYSTMTLLGSAGTSQALP